MEQNYNYNLTNNELKEKYISVIIQLMLKSDDISLLDLIKKLLEKST